MERVSLIDVSSSEDDILVSSSPLASVLPDPSPSENCESERCSVFEKVSIQMDHVPELSDSPKTKQATSGKYNLRKSLAWDNAFFTSEGVLDPEELAIVNSTFRKVDVHPLPCIEEDVYKSSESTATLDSDTWALDSLEVGLFDNIRASIQKSFGACEEASVKLHPSKTAQSANLGGQRVGLSKRAEVSQKNMKPPVGAKHLRASKQQPDVNFKVPVAASKGGTASRDLKSLLKPPSVAPRGNTLQTASSKMVSASGRIQGKCETKKAPSDILGTQQSLENFKKTNGGSRSLSSRATPSGKSSSASTSKDLVPSSVSSSCSIPVCSTSNTMGKPPLKTGTRRNDVIQAGHSSALVNAKTSLRTSMSKLGSRKATNLSGSRTSTVVFSSSVSPHSSIDSVASGSSSSTSAMKPSNSTESLGAISCSSSPSLTVVMDFGVPRVSEFRKLSIDQPYIRNEDAGITLQSPPSCDISSGTHVLDKVSSANTSGSCTDSKAGSKLFKPSGLRLPSPKIGYFDPEKSLVRNSNKSSETAPHIKPLKRTSGLSNSTGASKSQSSKVSSLRSATTNIMANSDSPQARAKFPSSIGGMKTSSPALPQPSRLSEVHGTPRKMENHHGSELAGDVSPGKTAEEFAGIPACGKSSLSPEKQSGRLLHPKSQTVTLPVEGSPSYDIGKEVIPEQSSKKGPWENGLPSVVSPRKENLNPAKDDSSNASMVKNIEEKLSTLCLSEVSASSVGWDSQLPSNSGDSDSAEQKLGAV